jgi:hypothetical protein
MASDTENAVDSLLSLGRKRKLDTQEERGKPSETHMNRLHEIRSLRHSQLSSYSRSLDVLAHEFAKQRESTALGTELALPLLHVCFGRHGGSGNSKTRAEKKEKKTLRVMPVAGMRMYPFTPDTVEKIERVQKFLDGLPAGHVSQSGSFFLRAPGHPYLNSTNAIVLVTRKQNEDFTQVVTGSQAENGQQAYRLKRQTYDFMQANGFVREEVGQATTWYFSPGRWNKQGHRLCPDMKTAKNVVDKVYTPEAWAEEREHLQKKRTTRSAERAQLAICTDTSWLHGRNAPTAAEGTLSTTSPSWQMKSVASGPLKYSEVVAGAGAPH